MSAVPRQPEGGRYAGLRMTADAYFALGETDERYELIDGVVCMSPRPGARHQVILWAIMEQVGEFTKRSGGRCFGEVDLVLGPGLVYTPDVMCFAAQRIRGFPARIDVPPDLVIEILSPSNRDFDLTRKRDDYARFGVREYWTVDSSDVRARCFRLSDGRFEERQLAGDTLSSETLGGLVVDLGPIREMMRQE